MNNFDDHTITMVPRRTDDVSRERMARWRWPLLDRCADRLPRLVVAFPKGAQRLTRPLDASYRGVSFEVVDISPYPRACRDDKPRVYRR